MNEPEKIDDFAGNLSELASKSASLGKTIEEPKLVNKFLNSLPRSNFIRIITSLEQVLDLKTTSYEDIVERLKAYEERILEEENHREAQGKLLYANSDQQSFSSSRGRERGRGGRGNRGRGRGGGSNSQERSTNQNQSKEKKDRSKTQEANKVETEEAKALYMHEIVFLRNKAFFSELNENIRGKMKFGDGSCVGIARKGLILFQSKADEQKLVSDIYYISELKSNILSLGQATESGCDVRMRQDYLTLHDPSGRLLVKI
ncbi:uncharacterized protein LOC112085163 [Eutrema salsugineum]|uniref:uncharacterized protein LOC112085163 n=1 Tax=Eutrema salsugineum TaxID=72664 RepID=UPI000CECFB06|nr:uncharacterized protein LOC112085163 [Eutrema salsugineum]